MKKKPKSIYELTANELDSITSDPAHPRHLQVMREIKEAFENDAPADPNHEALALAMQKGEREADSVLAFLDTEMSSSDLLSYPPIGIFTLMSVMERMDHTTLKNFRSAIANRQSDIAKKPRPNSQHPSRAKIKDCWFDWKQGRSYYSSNNDFANQMIANSKCSVSVVTIYSWIDSWESESKNTK